MTQTSAFYVSILLQLFIICRFAISYDDPVYFDYPPVVYTYNRLSEIEKECSPFVSSASQLKPDDSRSYKLKKELSFFDGDWRQEPGGAPLMPFDESDIPTTSSSLSSSLRLVGFEVKDVNPEHLLQNVVSLHGTMCIGIGRNTTLLYDSLSTFHIRPGMSVLKISFEGIYMETMHGGRERLLCMLGNTTLPFWKFFDGSGLSDIASSSSTFSNLKHRLLPDHRLLLVLRYPQTFSLTKRAILGELRSLNERGNDKYFDLVHIFSQLGPYSKYEFRSENLRSRSCDSSFYQVELEEDGTNVFNHTEFCNALRHFQLDHFTIVPNWRFIGRGNYSGRFGPFLFEQEINGDTMSYENVGLVLQNLICEQETTQFMAKNTKVAAVFRMFPLQQIDRSTASMRSGLSSMTLSVEGTWEASKGQLCMAGCLGVAVAGLEECDYQVSLYFPHSLSIKQRSAIFGSISSIRNEGNSNAPIIFELGARITDLFFNHPRYTRSYLFYNYSKVDLADASRKRNQLPRFFTAIKKLVLAYPALPDGSDIFARLSTFSDDLNILAHGIQVSSTHRDRDEAEIFINVEMVSLGPLLGRYYPWLQEDGSPIKGQVEISESGLLNVSLSLMFTEARLSFTEKYYRNISKLSLEGLYDPKTGDMHLIGCRKVLAKPESSNTERGFDCLIETKINYPAITMRWLINPTAKITITSQRKKDDPLYFSPIILQTLMIPYNNYEQDAVFRKVFEQILRNLMMTSSVILILSQYKYIKHNADDIPYISRAMLAFQLVGYGLPLICNTKILFPEKECKGPYNFYGYEQLLEIFDFTGKVLALAAFLLTVTLSRKVADFRRKHNHLPSNSRGVPHDKQVFLFTSAIHILGYLIYYYLYDDLFQNLMKSTLENDQKMKIWKYKEEEYLGFIQDMFLLPQIIGNIIWRTQGRPLQKFYYIGFTLLRLLSHLYDCVRDPLMDPYSNKSAILNLNLIFASKTPKHMVAVTMTVLTIVVYVQQSQKYKRLIQLPKPNAFKILSSKFT